MSKIFEQLLAARGLDRGFLQPKYEDCVDPYLLPDMEKAVGRIKQAVKDKERCIICGDYDVDGVTASTILHDALQMAGLTEVEIMLPNRFSDGYGMNKKVVQKAAETDVKLVFTVDCGSRNNEIIAELKQNGVEVIVTDHHECDEELPEALAVVNPKRRDVEVMAELRELAGAGVAFKLAQALVRAGLIPEGQEKWLLDLAMIGTICDNMLLTGENRRICWYGMLVLGKTRRLGLKELILNAGTKKMNGSAVGFQIGPRLNAAGRMETAEKALQLLLADKRTVAAQLASELELLNAARRKQQQNAMKEIQERGLQEGNVIIEVGQWHEGVLGIIAGKLTEEYKRPAFALAEVDGDWKGSGRSFGDFSLAKALDECRDLIVSGGGHAGACGVRLKQENLEAFRKAMNDYYVGLKLENQERFLEVKADIEVEDYNELSLELIEELRKLEPCGEGNREPIFMLPGARIMEAAKLGSTGRHLRLLVWDKTGKAFKLIGFAVPEEYFDLRVGDTVDALIALEENEYRGIRSAEGRIVKLFF